MADRTGRGPASDSGPFRVEITGVRSVFEQDFVDSQPTRRKGGPSGAGVLTVSLAVLAEPGLVLHQDGPAVVAEAVDDRGRSLFPPAPAPPGPGQANRGQHV